MDQAKVLAAINDLPSTFKRDADTTYLQFIDALTAALFRMTNAADGITSQLTIGNASGGWLDLWGMLFGLPRRANEADSTYFARITITLTGGAGPVQCMLNWVFTAWGLVIAITENLPSVGYVITFPATVSTVQIGQIIQGLAQIRPAGVPFTVVISNIGTYLDTVNYLNAGNVTGAYLGGGTTPVNLTLASANNNSPPLLPQLFLTDPTLNPSLAVRT